MFRFRDPWWLVLLIIPAWEFFAFFLRKKPHDPGILFPSTSVFSRIDHGGGTIKRIFSLFLAVETVVLLILAMARPQTGMSVRTRSEHGIDIVLCMDISSSMEALDFDPLTRYEASLDVVKDFINRRMSDRIGLVVFAAQSFTLCPLTLDYGMLTSFLDSAKETRIDDGTAIGSAIATSVNRLRTSDAASKIIILLTDGMNNRGSIDPVTAARIASSIGIKVYTIGVGTEGQAPIAINGRMYTTETHIDEATLGEVARLTGGNYYRATNKAELQTIYEDIDALEKSEFSQDEWVEYTDLYGRFIMAGLMMALLWFVLDRTILRRLP